MSLSRALVRAFRAATAAPMPDDVARLARLHLLDAIGVGLAAAALDQGRPYRALQTGTTGRASLLTGARSDDPAEAALINGGLIHALEFDDTHTGSIVHGSAVLAPAVLAAAEATGASLPAALIRYSLGYEALIRLGLAAPGAFQRRGFQITPVGGALITALMAADLAGADETTSVHAIGIALSQASGVFEFLTNGSSVKSLHPGWAAHAGLFAARLARAGMTGPETAIEGARGLFASFAGDAGAAAAFATLMQDFGQRWHLADVAFKFLPCCHYLHPFVEAAGQLAAAGLGADRIDRMTLRIADGAAGIVAEPWADKLAPRDGHAIRWSLPVVVAARLIEGRIDHATFSAPPSPAVLALAARCKWAPLVPNRFPQAFEAEIEAVASDGTVHVVRIPDVHGNAARPAGEAEVLAKFRTNAALSLPKDAAEAVQTLILTGTGALDGFAAALARSRPRSLS